MTLSVLKPGLQSTLQAGPRTGFRHMGMPYSGPADPLSMALANRLVSNPAQTPALEITYGGVALRFDQPTHFALTGAPAPCTLNAQPVVLHQTQHANAGDILEIGMPPIGMRLYLAVPQGFVVEPVLGSVSTYMPARLGGFHGRSLRSNDQLRVSRSDDAPDLLETPRDLRPFITAGCVLRTCASAETDLVPDRMLGVFFSQQFQASGQIDRMGIALDGPQIKTNSDGKMKSAAVFPGTVQCPEDGHPIILMADAQTTGGYPRIAHIARCDLHLLGQIRPRSPIRFLRRTHEEARENYAEKANLFADWLPDFVL